jgi:ABC-2 type transport system permease protein
MIIGVTGLVVFPLPLAHYKEHRIYKRLDAPPVGKGFVIWIQVAVNIVMTLLGFLLLFIVGKLAYEVKFEGELWSICLAILLSIAAIFQSAFMGHK